MNPQRTRSVAAIFLFLLAIGCLAWSDKVRVAESQPAEWRVWMKTSPCSGRTDWVSVAKENPTGGGNAFVQFPGSRVWRTFAEAMAEANTLRTSPLFSRYCCREYSVWKNIQTGKLSVVLGKFGNAGFGWSKISPDLCCEEAFAQAGMPSSCGLNTALSGKNLTYYPKPTSDGCKSDCDRNAQCKGYTWIAAGTYNRGDAAMCYLLASVTGGSSAKGTVSAMKGGVPIPVQPPAASKTPPKTPTSNGSGKLQLVDVTQNPKCSTWGNITSCSSGHITWGAPTNANYQWSGPPTQIGSEGFSITISVSESNAPDHRSATGIGLDGGSFAVTPRDPRVSIGASNQPMSGSLTVKVAPPKNPSGDYYLKVGVYWGPTFVYHYRAVK